MCHEQPHTGRLLDCSQSDRFVFEHDTLFVVNTVVASLQIAALLFFLSYFARRMVRSTLSHKRWSPRRLYGVVMSFTELMLQLINSCAFLTPNVRALATGCAWFSPVTLWASFTSWTVWNTLFLLWIIQASNLHPIRGPGSELRAQMINMPDGVL